MGNNVPIIKTQDGLLFAFANSTIGVDINGSKGPNQGGRDVFLFEIAENGIVIPYGSKLQALSKNYLYWQNNNDCSSNRINEKAEVTSCAGRVLEEDAMNY